MDKNLLIKRKHLIKFRDVEKEGADIIADAGIKNDIEIGIYAGIHSAINLIPYLAVEAKEIDQRHYIDMVLQAAERICHEIKGD